MIETPIKIHGMPEMVDLLKMLPDMTRMKVNTPAARAMVKITHGHAVANAPKGKTLALSRNIKIIKKRTNGPWDAIYGLRVKTARRKTWRRGNRGTERPFLEGFLQGEKAAAPKGPDDPYYWFFLEFGTRTKQGGVKIAERRFMRNALEAHTGQHIDAFTRKFISGLEREIKREYGLRFRKHQRDARG